MPNVYQVRGFDLANTSFVKGDTGWTIFDPLTYEEATGAALELVNRHLGKFPVKAVVYSHSHGDHWGGARGVVDEADDRAGNVEIIAPRDWFSDRRTVILADCQAVSQCISRYMDDGYGWIC